MINMIYFKRQKSKFEKTKRYLSSKKKVEYVELLNKYGKLGVAALKEATPKRTGLTSESWTYKVYEFNDAYKIEFYNSNLGQGWAPIAILLQYGHGTRNGGWVEGIDYINPALQPIFEKLSKEAWEKVVNAKRV